MDRRHFLQAAAVGAASSLAADAPPKRVDDAKPKFRLGLVTYNLAANWDRPSLLKACHAANISPELRAAIDALVKRKKAAEELDEGAAVPIINQSIDAELARLPAVADAMPDSRGCLRDLDVFLYDVRTEM